MTIPARCNVLMIYPRFSAESFWNYAITSELLGARYPTIPLGLITLAAMLPAHWTVRLVNRNTEALDYTDLDWADLVMTGGMLFQQADSLRLIRRVQARGKPVAIASPLFGARQWPAYYGQMAWPAQFAWSSR